MRLVLERSRAITDAEIAAWMEEAFLDTWMYDIEPHLGTSDARQTFEAYAEDRRRAYGLPEPAAERGCTVREVFAVDGVDGLVWIEAGPAASKRGSAALHGYFSPYDEAWLPVTTPTISGFDRTFIV